MALSNWLRSRSTTDSRRPTRRCRLGVLPLEDRTVPSASLLSSLGVGSAGGMSQARDVAADAAGNSYLTGFFNGTVDFDPAHAHAGDTDVLTSPARTTSSSPSTPRTTPSSGPCGWAAPTRGGPPASLTSAKRSPSTGTVTPTSRAGSPAPPTSA